MDGMDGKYKTRRECKIISKTGNNNTDPSE